jgi:hypothetical protein
VGRTPIISTVPEGKVILTVVDHMNRIYKVKRMVSTAITEEARDVDFGEHGYLNTFFREYLKCYTRSERHIKGWMYTDIRSA